MPKFQTLLDISSVFFVLVLPIFILHFEVSLETQFIATAINGMSSATGLIVGFTATAIAVSASQLFKFTKHRFRVSYTAVALVYPALLLVTAYTLLIWAEHHLAIRFALMALVVSCIILEDFMLFLGSELLIT